MFCGDLVDRGQNSPATVERVAAIVDAGRGQAVLGNHELNLVLLKRKEGNGWCFPDDHDQARGHFLDVQRAADHQRADLLEWMGSLPVVLERTDLRVVHACWDPTAVEMLRNDNRPIPNLYRDHSARLEGELSHGAVLVHERVFN